MEDLEIKISEILKKGAHIECNFLRLAGKGKKSLKHILLEMLKKQNAEHLVENIFSSVAEIIFNAIKANYKFLIIRDEIENILINEEKNGNGNLNEILSDETKFEHYLDKLNKENVKEKLRGVLSGEEKVNKIIEKVERESRNFSKDEWKEIKKNLQMNFRVKKEKMNVYVAISTNKENIIIDVINDAPLLAKDLARIKEKRERFHMYWEKGEEQNFFIENLDETESAGFGAAMVDARLFEFKVDPKRHFEIWGVKGKTACTLSFPIIIES